MLTLSEVIAMKDELLFNLENKVFDDFLKWFDKFCEDATSDVWLINEVRLKNTQDGLMFYWDSPSYDFSIELYSEDEYVMVCIEMTQPIELTFTKDYLDKETFRNLRNKIQKIYNHYTKNKDKVRDLKINAITQIMDLMKK